MADKEATAPREIVVIRRKGGDDEDGKKGGAWKIAFADFMTAMMAFFLVMWLINSSDKKTITQVATFFNPLKLADKNTSQKGVYDLTPDPGEKSDKEDEHKDPKAKGQTDKKPDNPPKPKPFQTEASGGRAAPDSDVKPTRFSEEELFSDPYGVLAKLALQAPNTETRLGPGALKELDKKEARGDAWRDPFDPSTWRPTKKVRSEADTEAPKPKEQQKAAAAAEPVPPADSSQAKTAEPAVKVETAGGQPTPAAAQAAKALASEITDALRNLPPTASRPEISVEATPEGLLISLTDKSDFGMFNSGSAEPRPELVVLMENVAKALAAKPGNIVIRGHTDARPFRGGASDNWRLSTSRAHVTQYMLVRGGVPERRIERIEGYADQKPKVTDDPMSARNRRIEILLRVPT